MDRPQDYDRQQNLRAARVLPPGTTSQKLTTADVPRLRDQWFEKYKDITSGVPAKLPPLREINHRIPLINEAMVYHYHLPRCADAIKPALMEKIKRYTNAKWWVPATVPQAAPMLCIAKKDGGLRTVVDCRKRNDNTVKDVTPFLDQEQIRLDVARAPGPRR